MHDGVGGDEDGVAVQLPHDGPKGIREQFLELGFVYRLSTVGVRRLDGLVHHSIHLRQWLKAYVCWRQILDVF